MFFKHIFIMISFLLLVACDLKIKDSAPKQDELIFADENKVKCISKTVPYFEAFLRGEPEGAKVVEFWSCSALAMSTFKTKTKGVQDGFYSAKAMAVFLEKYFLDNMLISDSLIEEAMRLKQIFLGGSIKEFSIAELDQLVVMFNKFGELTQDLYPYMVVYTGKWKPKATVWDESEVQYFENASVNLTKLVQQLVAWVRPDSLNYPIDNFLTFLREFDKMMNHTVDFAAPVARLYPVLKKLKVILASGSVEVITAKEWQNFLTLGSKGYMIYLRWDLFLSERNIGITEKIWATTRVLDEIFVLVTELLKDKNNTKISGADLYEILLKFHDIYPSFTISKKIVDQLMLLKKSLLGSSSEYWELKDFEKARDKVQIAKELALKLLPYLDLFLDTWQVDLSDPSTSQEYLRQAFKTLHAQKNNFVALWDEAYDFANLLVLFNELLVLYPQNSDFKELKNKWQSYLPLFLSSKKILIADNSAVVGPEQWKKLLTPALNLLQIYEKQKYFPNIEKSFLTKTSITYWSGLINSVFIELELALKLQPHGQQIKLTDVESFLKLIEQAHLTTVSLNVSKSLLRHLMTIKKSVLGTSENSWSMQDLAQIRPKISFAKSLVIELLPYLDIIKGDWRPDIKDINKSKQRLKFLLQIFNGNAEEFIGLWKAPFDWALVPDILADFIKILPQETELIELADKWNTYFSVVVATKQIIMGNDSTSLDAKSWRLFYQPAFAIYDLYLQYRFIISKEDFLVKNGFESWNSLLNSIFYQLDVISIVRGQIPLADIDSFIEVLEKSDLMRLNFDKKLINKFGPLLLTKYLIDPKFRPHQGLVKGLTHKHFEYITLKWANWAEAERFLLSLLAKTNGEQMKLKELQVQVKLIIDQFKNNRTYSFSVMQISNALLSSQNLFLTDNLILPITNPEQNVLQLNAASLSYLNIVRAVVDLAFVGYLPQGKSFMSGIEETEFKVFISELMPVLQDMGWLKKAKATFAESRFLEGNLLTPSADGNDILSFQEGIELIIMLISGVVRSEELVKATQNSCHLNKSEFTDIYCFRGILFESKVTVYKYMPSWLSFLNGLNREEVVDFSANLERGAEVEIVGEEIFVPDLLLLTNLSQYIEIMFTRFNTNGDYILDTEEAMQAFPLFKRLLTQLSKLDDPVQVRSVFAYILKYARAPEQNVAGLIEFGLWASNPADWHLQVDRMQMAKIFKFIQAEKNKQQ